MQVYRGMDIGTAKPSATEQAEVSAPPSSTSADPCGRVGVTRWTARPAARPSPASAHRGHRALLVGGTGLYFQAVVDGLEPPGGSRKR